MGIKNQSNIRLKSKKKKDIGIETVEEERHIPLFEEINGVKYKIIKSKSWSDGKNVIDTSKPRDIFKVTGDFTKDELDSLEKAYNWNNLGSLLIKESSKTISEELKKRAIKKGIIKKKILFTKYNPELNLPSAAEPGRKGLLDNPSIFNRIFLDGFRALGVHPLEEENIDFESSLTKKMVASGISIRNDYNFITPITHSGIKLVGYQKDIRRKYQKTLDFLDSHPEKTAYSIKKYVDIFDEEKKKEIDDSLHAQFDLLEKADKKTHPLAIDLQGSDMFPDKNDEYNQIFYHCGDKRDYVFAFDKYTYKLIKDMYPNAEIGFNEDIMTDAIESFKKREGYRKDVLWRNYTDYGWRMPFAVKEDGRIVAIIEGHSYLNKVFCSRLINSLSKMYQN